MADNTNTAVPSTTPLATPEKLNGEAPRASNEVSQAAPQTTQSTPDPLQAKFAQLAKKEKAILTRAKEIEAKAKMLEEMEARFGKYKEYEGLEKEVKVNPLKLLEKYGLSYNDLTQFILNDNKPTPDLEIKSVREEIQALKAEKERERQEQIEAEKRRAIQDQEQAVAQFKEEISGFINSNPDSSELISLYGAQEVVYETIEEYFKKTSEEGEPKILSVKEAVELVEDYLYKQTQKATQTAKKFKPKEEPKKEESKQTMAKTLTNELTSSAPSMLPAATENDRIQRALAALAKSK